MVQLNCRIEQGLADRLNQAASARQLDIETVVGQAIEQFLATDSRQTAESLATDTSVIAKGLAELAKRVETLEAAAKATQEAPATTNPSPEREKVDGLLAALMAKPAPQGKA